MKFYMLASGSKGNAFILDTNDSKILIDCGTTKRYLNESFDSTGYKPLDFDAVLITHKHTDHISQIKMFAQHPNIYTPEPLIVNHRLVNPYESFLVRDLNILPIATSHDADVSVGYVIETDGKKIVYVTDTGYVKDSDIELMKGADIIVLESNHDPELLMKTRRPYMIKQRILSDYGHLSNEMAGIVLSKIVTENTKEIILAHLSQEANSEEVALKTVSKHLNGYKGILRVGKQYEIVSGLVPTRGDDVSE